jgi:vacuolar-type H+-ATPase subunit E/Vma4
VIDKLRTTEYDSFVKVGVERAKTATEDAYTRINREKELIKQRIKQTGATNKDLFKDLID